MRFEVHMVMSVMMVVRPKGMLDSYNHNKWYGDAPAHLEVKCFRKLAG
jgi:hypothetical protein